MARRVWDGDFASIWFGFRNPLDRRVRRPDLTRSKTGPVEAGEKPGSIVERNRRARREKWALRTTC